MTAAAAGLWLGTAAAVPTEQASLNSCQNAVKTEAAKFVKNKAAAIENCLQAISTQLVKNNAADTSGAAATCVTQFRMINDSRGAGKSIPEKLAAGITKKCAPGQANVTHTLADVLGPGATVTQPINADNLAGWCGQFGGTGAIASLSDWINCIRQSQECAVDTAVSMQYPRALEWLAAVEPKMQALTPPSTDPDKINDAVDGLDSLRASIGGPGGDELNVPNMRCGRKDFVATGQTTSYTAGDDGAVKAGAALRYLDNSDGTITDLDTGLMWEKKIQLDGTTNAANLNDADNCYPWAGSCAVGGALCGTDLDCGANGPCNAATGWCEISFATCSTDTDCGGQGPCHHCQGDNLTIFKWAAALNAENSGAGFAGHNDWRVPNLKELVSIVNYGANPAVSTAFQGASCGASCTDLTDPACSCTQSDCYRSSTTLAPNPSYPDYAWLVCFGFGNEGISNKTLTAFYVRAVRGGS